MKGYFVYMFLDIEDNVLYIGSSIHLVKRIEQQHFLSQYGNLSEECILATHKILYHQGVSSDDMKIKERYLINKENPQYNVKLNNNSKFSFTIDIDDWKLYSLNTEALIEKRAKSKNISQIVCHNLEIKKVQDHLYDTYFSYAMIDYEHKNSYFTIDLSKVSFQIENKEIIEKSKLFLFLINNEYYVLGLNLDKLYQKNLLTNGFYLNIDLRNCNQYLEEGFFVKTDLESYQWEEAPNFGIKYDYLKEENFFGIELQEYLEAKLSKIKRLESNKIDFTNITIKQIKNHSLNLINHSKLFLKKDLKSEMRTNYIEIINFEVWEKYSRKTTWKSLFLMINKEFYIYSSHLHQYLFNPRDIKNLGLSNKDYIKVEIEDDHNFRTYYEDHEIYEQGSNTFFLYNTVKKLNILSNELINFFDRELSNLNVIENNK